MLDVDAPLKKEVGVGIQEKQNYTHTHSLTHISWGVIKTFMKLKCHTIFRQSWCLHLSD